MEKMWQIYILLITEVQIKGFFSYNNKHYLYFFSQGAVTLQLVHTNAIHPMCKRRQRCLAPRFLLSLNL